MAEPQSRAEAIVQATINGEEYKGLPQSRLEALLIELNHSGGGGGGGDYEHLANLPTINGDPVEGDITQMILDLVEPFNSEDENDLLDIIEDDPATNDAGHQDDDFEDD